MSKDRRIFDAIMVRIDNSNHLEFKLFEDAFSALRNVANETGHKDMELSNTLKTRIRSAMKSSPYIATDLYALYWRVMCWEATDCFDSFVLYMEHNRDRSKQFYLPRRKQLKPLTDALQDLEDRKLELLAISLPPGVGKTTLAEFFLVWTAGRHPEKPILTGSHSNAFLRGLYSEIQRFLSPTGDYCWKDVFPQLKVISTNAQDMLIDIGENNRAAKRFTTFQFRSVGSANAGVVRAENLLYCDDLVDGLESAMSKERMDKLYNLYAVDLRQRKIGDCVELHIATRWSVHDVIGHLEQMYGGSDKARFISVPALDENDESNFDYPIEAGFTTEFYHDQREAMDDVSWRALYMNQPIEREGLLYSEQALRRYFELPDSEPDAILSVCDTKDKGSDYCVMPIVYQYGNDFYVEDVICDNSNPDIVDDRLISILLKHKVHLSQFESNAAGGRVAEKVQNAVKDRGGRTKILTKFTTANKDTKIVVNQPWVLEHCIFKDASKIKENKEYRTFLNFLCSYTMAGKNKHDDVPDAMAMLAEYCQGMLLGKAEIMARPW